MSPAIHPSSVHRELHRGHVSDHARPTLMVQVAVQVRQGELEQPGPGS